MTMTALMTEWEQPVQPARRGRDLDKLCMATKTIGWPVTSREELYCVLPLGHTPDLHYDDVEDITWKRGRP